jgi:hypothetical protein
MDTDSKPARILGSLLIFTALVTGLYWLDYFTGGNVKTSQARWYTSFEAAFPVADGWLALTSLVAGIALLKRLPWSGAVCLLAGSALLYLAAMDITFNLENGLYDRVASSGQMQFELLINVWSLGLGIWSVWAGWKRTVSKG